MPPKRKIRWGRAYHSSEDEDYLPPGSPPQPQSSKSKKNSSKQQNQEDLPLTQRRHALQQQQQSKKNQKTTSLTAVDETTGLPCPLNFKFEVPEEVLHNILLHWCRIEGAISSAPIALCINKAWRSAVLSCPELWKNVDLSYGWCRPTNSILESYSSKWAAINNLSLEGCSAISETGLLAIAENCPKLGILNLSHCKGFRDKGLGDALCRMLARPKSDTSSPLRELILSSIQIAPKSSGLDSVLRRILLAQANNPTEGPVLESLVVESCPMLSHRPLKAVYDASAVAGKPLLRALKVLSLDGSAGTSSGFTLNILRLQLAAPNLRSVHLCYISHAMGWQANVFTSGLPEGAAEMAMWKDLKILYVTRAQSTADYLYQMLRNSPNLEEVALLQIGCLHVDTFIEILFSDYTATTWQPRQGLKRLGLDGTFVWGRGLEGINGEATYYDVFVDSTWMWASLQELSVAGCKHSFNDDVCKELATYYPNLVAIDARDTGITEKGVKVLVESALERGLIDCSGGGNTIFELNIDSCRAVDRTIRQAASKSMHDLVKALGLCGGGGDDDVSSDKSASGNEGSEEEESTSDSKDFIMQGASSASDYETSEEEATSGNDDEVEYDDTSNSDGSEDDD